MSDGVTEYIDYAWDAIKCREEARLLWRFARHGNLLESTVAAALIRKHQIVGPHGEAPVDA